MENSQKFKNNVYRPSNSEQRGYQPGGHDTFGYHPEKPAQTPEPPTTGSRIPAPSDNKK